MIGLRGIALGIALAATSISEDPGGVVMGTLGVEEVSPDGAVVYLVPEAGASRLSAERTVIDQRRLRFIPDVVVVAPGAEVAFRNSDPLHHNIFSPESEEPFNLGTYPEGQERTHRFREPGAHVILCNIHPEMEAYVFVAATPYWTVLGRDGAFRFEVPAGRYRFYAWHRRVGIQEQNVLVPEGRTVHLEVRLSRSAAR
jgi:plastocyanin